MSSAIDCVCGSHPVLVHILHLVGNEDAQVGAVNKAFSRALEVLKKRVSMQLMAPLFTVHGSGRQDSTASERLQAEYIKTIRVHEQWLVGAPLREWAFGSNEVTYLLNAVYQLKNRILGLYNDSNKNMRSARLCAELARWEGERQTAIDWTAGRNEVEAAYQEDTPFPALYRSLRDIIIQERLINRCFSEVLPIVPFESHYLAVLHTSQRRAARVNSASEEQFAALPAHSFSRERFLRAEEIIIDAEIQGSTLLEIGEQIRRAVEAGPDRRIGSVFPNTAAAWRLWFGQQHNIRHIHAVVSLRLHTTVFPEELWQCRNLRELEITVRPIHEIGPLDREDPPVLPQQIANLTSLTRLSLDRIRFQTVPEVIGRLRNLEYLRIWGAEIEELPLFLAELRHLSWLDVRGNPIRVLPDPIFQRLAFNHRDFDRPCNVFIDPPLTVPFAFQFQTRYWLTFPTLQWGGFQYIVYAFVAIPLLLYQMSLKITATILTLIRDLLGYDRLVPAN
ncbi:MAG: leucine-rich repeat domain-containing protein [Chlamydiales bacterium]